MDDFSEKTRPIFGKNNAEKYAPRMPKIFSIRTIRKPTIFGKIRCDNLVSTTNATLLKKPAISDSTNTHGNHRTSENTATTHLLSSNIAPLTPRLTRNDASRLISDRIVHTFPSILPQKAVKLHISNNCAENYR